MNDECDPAPSFYPLLHMSLESKSHIKSKWEQKAAKDFNEFILSKMWPETNSVNQHSIASRSNRRDRLFGQFYFSDSLRSFIILISIAYFLCGFLLALLLPQTPQLHSPPPWSHQLAALARLPLYQLTWASTGCTVCTTWSLTTKEGKRKTKQKHPRGAVYRSRRCQPGEALQKGVFWLRRSSTACLCRQRRNLVQCDHISPANEEPFC